MNKKTIIFLSTIIAFAFTSTAQEKEEHSIKVIGTAEM